MEWGTLMDNGSWTGMIGQLERRVSMIDNNSWTGMIGQLERLINWNEG